MTRPITEAEVTSFWSEGVVVLRGILPTNWLAGLDEAVEHAIGSGETANLGPIAGDSSTSSPGFFAGVDHWKTSTAFSALAFDSPVVPIVASLLRSRHLWLWEDSLLVKEPGAPFETKFHSDDGYFHVSGEQVCTVWIPLDPAGPHNGALRWVRGSHNEGVSYRPNLFVTDEPLPHTVGSVVPEVEGSPEFADRMVSYDLEPGDITVHHARTLHGAPANASTSRRRAVSIRYCGDDARYCIKPGLSVREGLDASLDGHPVGPPICPAVLSATS